MLGVLAGFVTIGAVIGLGALLAQWRILDVEAQRMLSRLAFFVALLLLFTALGALVESLGMIVITVPLLYPLLAGYGVDPVWFGIVVVVFVEMGQITPPIGINLFVIQSIARGSLSDVVMGTIPFHLLMFLLLGLLVVWPELALWLPAQLSGR